ncbi:immune inhibitor A [Chloroflexota bacterium]|nr:immune inhibitor A [Chloroflexota bacterium]
MEQKSKTLPIILIILLVLVLCCIVISVGLIAGGVWLKEKVNTSGGYILPTETVTITEVTPETTTNKPVPDEAIETLDTLDQTIVPINDPVELAERLGGKQNVPDTLIDPDAPYSVGARKTFWVGNTDTNENFQITAVLRYVGENSYFWIEEGVEYDPSDLEYLGDLFDQEIVPTDREFFGSEWNPGVDGDPHIYVLYAGNLGYSLAGYFSSADELNPLAHEYSNAHEMFLINSDNVPLWDSYIYGVLAHEFQHMIHWYTDRNEATWMNEGFSMLAELLNGFDIGGHDYSYLVDTDLQLTDWGDSVGDNSPNYGASFLFMAYFLDRFGEEATQAVVAAPDNSMESITRVLDELGISDPLTGEPITADDVLADWAVANILLDPTVGDGRYDYSNYNPMNASITETHSSYPDSPIRRYVHQYGVDSILFTDLTGEVTLTFTGSTTVSLLPESAYSGSYAFYSNKGDESDMTLTQTFDFTNVDSPIEMTYQTWYDLETDYDYLYLEASTDGETWHILDTPSCTNYDPSGNSYGCGYNGETGGWIYEAVDLSQFAGQEVTLRFEYITDAAVNGEGLLLDDVSIPTIGYTTDFESDDGGWEAQGFARVNNLLPQTFKVSVIQIGDETTVTHLALSDLRTASIDIILNEGDQVIVVVSGTTPFTNQEASYQIDLE